MSAWRLSRIFRCDGLVVFDRTTGRQRQIVLERALADPQFMKTLLQNVPDEAFPTWVRRFEEGLRRNGLGSFSGTVGSNVPEGG